MNWVDYLTLFVMIAIIIISTLRGRHGVGLALFDTVAAVAATWVAHHFYVRLSNSLHISTALAYVLLFAVAASALFFATGKLHTATQLEFPPFDPLISMVLGIVAAWAMAFALLEIIGEAVPDDSPTIDRIAESRVATQILTFRMITGTKAFMDSVKFGPKP